VETSHCCWSALERREVPRQAYAEALEKPRRVVSGRGKGAGRPAEDTGSEQVDTEDTTVTPLCRPLAGLGTLAEPDSAGMSSSQSAATASQR
jgi:hypothetical protein